MDRKTKLLRYLPAAIGVVLVLAIAVAVYLLQDLFEKPAKTKKTVQQITVIQPPPPPPPPPEQPPPPPEVKEEKIEEPEPEPEPEPEQPEEAPPSEDLGVDAEGAAGSDGFGLVGKKGGRGLIGGGGGSAIIWYGQQVQKEVSSSLQQRLDGEVRRRKFSALAHIWIGSDGGVSRAELAGSSGDAQVDAALRDALGSLRVRIQQPPPPGMPQPVKIRIHT
jgi:protein TonB